jgi:hypothetical protein
MEPLCSSKKTGGTSVPLYKGVASDYCVSGVPGIKSRKAKEIGRKGILSANFAFLRVGIHR